MVPYHCKSLEIPFQCQVSVVSVMIPKCELPEDIDRIDRMVTELERERGLDIGKIQFDLIVETARESEKAAAVKAVGD